MMRGTWRIRVARLLAAWLAFGCAAVVFYRLPSFAGLIFNPTESEPPGVYRTVNHPLKHRELITLKPPEAAGPLLARYFSPHVPLLKRIAAMPGDTVTIGAEGVRVNGALWPKSAPLDHDAEGRLLKPYPFGTYRLGPAELWVMSNHPQGFDSRYFGPIARANVLSTVKPVVTWTSPTPACVSVLLMSMVLALAAGVSSWGALKVVDRKFITSRREVTHEA